MSSTKRRFKTNVNGELPAGCRLEANTVYAVVPDLPPAASGFKDKEELVSWIRNCVLGDLRTLRVGIQHYHADTAKSGMQGMGGGNFLLASGCCLALEYFARIFNGSDNAVDNVRRYAGQFLKPINVKYVEVGVLVWRVFRNGLIHGSWPKSIRIGSETGEQIMVGVGVETGDPHLSPVPKLSGNSLALNAMRFLEDLEASVEGGFAEWILKSTDPVLERGAPQFLILHKADSVQKEIQHVLQWNNGGAG